MISSRHRVAWVVAAAVFAVFLPSLANDYVSWDDNLYIYENPHVRSLDLRFLRWALTDVRIDYWQPVSWLSHAIDYALWGPSPVGSHLGSILLHALNTLLVVLLAATLVRQALSRAAIPGGRAPLVHDHEILIAGAAAGLFFGLHPLRVEAVAWAAERKDILCAFFFLLSIRAYVSYRNGSRPQYAWSLVFFLLALASKPMAVSLPLVLLLLDWYPLNLLTTSAGIRRSVREKMPFFVLSLIIAAATLAQQRSIGAMRSLLEIPLADRVLLAVRAIGYYLSKTLYPAGLVPFYPIPRDVSLLSVEFGIPLLAAAAITLVCLWQVKRSRAPAALWSYFLIALAPTLALLPAGDISMADRYTYLPAIGPSLLVGLSATLAWRWSRARADRGALPRVFLLASGAAVVAFLSFLTIQQIGVWKNSLTFWNYIIEKKPNQIPIAYNQRGIVYAEQGDREKAFMDFTTAISLSPRAWSSYQNRGVLFLEMGRYGDALSDFDAALALFPESQSVLDNRGVTYARLGRAERALQDLSRAIEIDPEFIRAYLDRGELLEGMGRRAQAVEDFRKACDLGSEAACGLLAVQDRAK